MNASLNDSVGERREQGGVLSFLFTLRNQIGTLTRLAATVAAAGVVFACAAVTWSVLARSVFGLSTFWEMEAAVYTLIYAALLSAAFTDRSGGQIGVRLLADRLKGRMAEFHQLVLDLLTLGLFSVFTWSAWDLLLASWETGWTTGTIWGPPLWLPHAAFPIGGGLLVLAVGVDVLIRLCGGSIELPAHGEGH